jgi:2-polyprenyl-3-methyl-5-hydroxy-6-metoxy-1,4-benzoquinol methylase
VGEEEVWDNWNLEACEKEVTQYRSSLLHAVVRRIKDFGRQPRILEVGCGTGWMSAVLSIYGSVCGVDLSPKAIELASASCPEAEFHCGDFMTVDLQGSFDIVVTADTIAHVPDQPGFIDRIASLMRPDGMLILMSQNAYALKRSSWVDPSPAHRRRWPSLRELRAHLAKDFDVTEVTTAAAGGATDGIYWLVNSRTVTRILGAVIGDHRVERMYERLWLGSEWVVVARRR